MRRPRVPSLRAVLALLMVGYLGAALGAYGLADRLIFVPPQPSYVDSAEVVKIPVPATAETISAVYRPLPGAAFTVLYSHGNGNDLGELGGAIGELRALGFAVLAYDYEGYGTSTGSPSEAAVARDVDAAYLYLRDRLGVPASRIIDYGFSLGGAAAIDLATRREVAAVVLESTFVTAFRVRTGISLVPFDRFDNLSKIARIDRPILILHARNDAVIAHWHAEALFAAARPPKEMVSFERGGHGGLASADPARYAAALGRLRRSLEGGAPLGCAPGSADCDGRAGTATERSS